MLQILLVPCYQSLPGQLINMTADKTIVLVGLSGSRYGGVNTHSYLGVRTPPGFSGFRQVASATATSFYISGNGGSASGFRYIANMSTSYSEAILGQNPGEPGYTDARGVVIYSNVLYGTSGDTNYSKVFQIGGAVMPTSHTT